MSIWVSLFIADFINNIMLSIFTIKNKENRMVKFYLKYFFIIIMVTLLTDFLIVNAPQMAKTMIKILSLSFLVNLISDDSFSKNLMQVFLVSAVFMIFDCIFGFFYAGILKLSPEAFQNSWLGIISVNILIVTLVYITVSIPKINNSIQNISSLYSRKDAVNLTGNVILCIFSLWFFMQKNTVDNVSTYDHIMNFTIIIIIIGFVIGFFKENSDKKQLKRKYDSLIDYAKTYEQEVIEKSKWQHEYENQLILIRDKIKIQTPDQAINYINDLLKNKPTDENVEWLTKLSQFPDIGIKGLLHYKICQMKELDINVFVDVTTDVVIKKNSKASKRLEENLQDISRILGVYLDNAMQAAGKSSNKYIVLEFKTSKNEIVFEISNTYNGKLEVEKLNQEKFTTKGSGHGYGLSLSRDILAKNKYLSQKKEINGMYFVQKLIIDIKK